MTPYAYDKSISSFVIPANSRPLKTALIVHPNGPPPNVKIVFKAMLAILFRIVVIFFESNI